MIFCFFCSTLLHHFFLKNNDEKLKTKKLLNVLGHNKVLHSSAALWRSRYVREGNQVNITNKICHSKKGQFFEAVSSYCVENQDYDEILIILWCTTPGARTKLSSRSYKQPRKPVIYFVWKLYNFLIELETNGKSTGYMQLNYLFVWIFFSFPFLTFISFYKFHKLFHVFTYFVL